MALLQHLFSTVINLKHKRAKISVQIIGSFSTGFAGVGRRVRRGGGDPGPPWPCLLRGAGPLLPLPPRRTRRGCFPRPRPLVPIASAPVPTSPRRGRVNEATSPATDRAVSRMQASRRCGGPPPPPPSTRRERPIVHRPTASAVPRGSSAAERVPGGPLRGRSEVSGSAQENATPTWRGERRGECLDEARRRELELRRETRAEGARAREGRNY